MVILTNVYRFQHPPLRYDHRPTSLLSFPIDHLTSVHPVLLSAHILLPLPPPEHTPDVHISVDLTRLGTLKLEQNANICVHGPRQVGIRISHIITLTLILPFSSHPIAGCVPGAVKIRLSSGYC
jgi:hypothetical protein